jgi:hypothetical protein
MKKPSFRMSYIERWVPDKVIHTSWGITEISEIRIYPPNTHPSNLIRKDLYRVDVICSHDTKRSFGFENAKIDSFLRVRVSGYSDLWEEVNNWEIAKSE